MAGKPFVCLFFAFLLSGLALRAQDADLFPSDSIVREIPDDRLGDGEDAQAYRKKGYYDRIPRLRDIPKVDASAFPTMRDRYRSDEFNYEEDVVQTNILQRVMRRLQNWLEHLMPDRRFFRFGDWFYKTLALIAIVAVLLILYRALFSGSRLLVRSEKEPDEGGEIRFVEKNLLDVDLSAYIARAEKDGNYALAIRYLNLMNIQLLARRDIIRWKPAKTNAELIEEIKDPEIRDGFKHNVLIFNWVWFGNAVPDGSRYEEYARRFLQFQSKWT